MTSRDAALDIMADAIHATMCFRAAKTPTCKHDRGDALIMLEYLEKHSVRIERKENQDA